MHVSHPFIAVRRIAARMLASRMLGSRRIAARTLIVGLLTGVAALAGQETPAAPAVPSPSPAQAAPQPAPSAPPAQAGAPAQPEKNPDGTFTIRRNSRLVVLDVVVTDKQGNVVTDLTKSDFSVTEAKEPQTIQNFEATGTRGLTPDVTINSTVELDKLAPRAPVNIILLDEFNTRFEDEAFARYSLKKFLERQPARLTTPTMLIAVDINKFMVLKDYTQDRGAILDALDHHLAALPWRNTLSSWAPERYGTAFGTLMRVSEAVIGHPGHKNMIWIGRGFPPFGVSSASLDAEQRVNTMVQRCVNMLRDARVTLYSIDPAGLQVDRFAYGADAEFSDPFGGNYNFNKLARATGGKALYGRNDVDAEIATGIRDGESFYTLTYRPTNDSRDPSKFRKIAVTLTRPGLTATTRQGYYLEGGQRRVDPMKPSRQLAFDLGAAANSGMVYDGLPMTVSAMPQSTTDYKIHIDAKGMYWYYATDTAPRYAEFIVTVTQFDKKGKLLKETASNVKVHPVSAVAPTGRIEVPVDLKWVVPRESKAVRARFVVRMSSTGRIGSADVDFDQTVAAAAGPS